MLDSLAGFAVSLVIACLIDALIGDPAWPFHPVRLIGNVALALENLTRRFWRPYTAGALTWVTLVMVVGAAGFGLSVAAWRLGAWYGRLLDGLLLWAAIAPRDLASHALRVWRPLVQGDLIGARQALAMVVGRNTLNLDQAGIVRATVETLAESTVDGVWAPLFWAALVGPAAALVYRAINTMDSLFGHHTERYNQFGYLAAKSDDWANFWPARSSIIPILGASGVLRLNSREAWRCFRRDRLKHDSPNAAHAEAAFAGALGVRLGGPSEYAEGIIEKPYLGTDRFYPQPTHIRQAIWLMLIASLIGAVLTLAIRWAILFTYFSISELF